MKLKKTKGISHRILPDNTTTKDSIKEYTYDPRGNLTSILENGHLGDWAIGRFSEGVLFPKEKMEEDVRIPEEHK